MKYRITTSPTWSVRKRSARALRVVYNYQKQVDNAIALIDLSHNMIDKICYLDPHIATVAQGHVAHTLSQGLFAARVVFQGCRVIRHMHSPSRIMRECPDVYVIALCVLTYMFAP
jgi:hypothetical protein